MMQFPKQQGPYVKPSKSNAGRRTAKDFDDDRREAAAHADSVLSGKVGPPRKAPKKTGIGGAIGGLIEKMRAGGRPKMSDSVPGAPRAAADDTAVTSKRKAIGGFLRKRMAQSVVDDPAGTSGDDEAEERVVTAKQRRKAFKVKPRTPIIPPRFVR